MAIITSHTLNGSNGSHAAGRQKAAPLPMLRTPPTGRAHPQRRAAS